jgi:hypothetical protein
MEREEKTVAPYFNRNEEFVRETAPHLGDRGYYSDAVFEDARHGFRHYGPRRSCISKSTYTPRFYGIGPANYVRSDDQIRDDIRHRLDRAVELDATNIVIEVVAGRAILSGSVPEAGQRFLAEESIGDVIGATHIDNRLSVAPPKSL